MIRRLAGYGRRQSLALGFAERDRLAKILVPANGDNASVSRDLPGRVDDRLTGCQARRAKAFYRYLHCQVPVIAKDLRSQVHLNPHHDIVWLATEDLRVKRVSAFFEVSQEHRMVDVTERVCVPPSDINRMLKYRGHELAPFANV
jgi:hypothetical protein